VISVMASELFKLRKKIRAWLGPLLIMILVLIAFPLSIDISQYDLNKFYFSIIVISLLVISFLATETMFVEDFEDGTLEQIYLQERDFYKLALAKVLIYVLLIGVPMSLIGSLFSFANGVDASQLPQIFITLIFSTLLLFNLFAFGAALSINKGAMLGVLATLPLALPVIILLGRAIRAVQFGNGFYEIMALMIGAGLLVAALVPLVISITLRTHLE